MEQRIAALEAENAQLRSKAETDLHERKAQCPACLTYQHAKQSLELRVAALSTELRNVRSGGPSSSQTPSSNSIVSTPKASVQLPSFDASMDGLFGDEGSSLMKSLGAPTLLPPNKPSSLTPQQLANLSAIDIYGIPDVEELRKSLNGHSSLSAKLVDDYCTYFLALIATRESAATKRTYMSFIRSYLLLNAQASAEDKPGIFLNISTFFTKSTPYYDFMAKKIAGLEKPHALSNKERFAQIPPSFKKFDEGLYLIPPLRDMAETIDEWYLARYELSCATDDLKEELFMKICSDPKDSAM
ncbi:hypothetical protein BC830DRAFT_1223615, partial [Chytriomyces sp. MP71]